MEATRDVEITVTHGLLKTMLASSWSNSEAPMKVATA